jgi:hypothetical protein
MNEISEILKNKDNLFHYSKTYIAIENILYEKRLRLTSRKKSTDPIENMPIDIYETIVAFSENLDKLEKSTEKTTIEIKQNVKKQIENIRQVCFCMNNNNIHSKEDYGFIRPRMWEQYGDKYKGVCIVFSKKELLKNEKIKFKGKVNYLNYKELEHKYCEIDRNKIGSKKYVKNLYNSINESLFWKHEDYKGENEFRICTLEEEEYDYIDIEHCIKAIIAPLKDINHYSLEKLREYSKKMGIDLINISWKSNNVSHSKDMHFPPRFMTFYN